VRGCETVQASSYSKVLGTPVALLGLGAYATIFVYMQIAAVDAVCEWCLASDALVTVLAVLTLLRLRAAD
jgi:uncharacterized membrane protein